MGKAQGQRSRNKMAKDAASKALPESIALRLARNQPELTDPPSSESCSTTTVLESDYRCGVLFPHGISIEDFEFSLPPKVEEMARAILECTLQPGSPALPDSEAKHLANTLYTAFALQREGRWMQGDITSVLFPTSAGISVKVEDVRFQEHCIRRSDQKWITLLSIPKPKVIYGYAFERSHDLRRPQSGMFRGRNHHHVFSTTHEQFRSYFAVEFNAQPRHRNTSLENVRSLEPHAYT